MSRNLKDPLFIGIRALEAWADKDVARRYGVEWRGVARLGRKPGESVGGFTVSLWKVPKKGVTVNIAPTLQDAAHRAIARFEAEE